MVRWLRERGAGQVIDALFILCVGTVVVIVMLLEFPGDSNRMDKEDK